MSEAEKRWLYFAAEDLRTAEITLREGIHNQTCFHAHQCVEKSLKALLIKLTGRTPPRTHSIAELLHYLPTDILKDAPPDLSAVLDSFYISTRYPDALIGSLPNGLPGLDDARLALDLARQVFAWIKPTIEL